MVQPVERRELGQLKAQLQRELAAGRQGPDIREPPTYVVWAGVRLLWAVLGLIALLLAGLLAYLALATPGVIAFGSPVTPDSFALYQRGSDLVFQRVTTLLDQVVIKVLLPVLTLLLGYVFGARAGRPAPPGNGSG